MVFTDAEIAVTWSRHGASSVHDESVSLPRPSLLSLHEDAVSLHEDAVPRLSQCKNGLHKALQNGLYSEAYNLIESENEDFLIECYENYEGYSPPSHMSSLHLIAGLPDKASATTLCKQLLNKINIAENRERLLNATVVEQFVCGPHIIPARAAAIHIAAYNGNMGVVRVLSKEYGVDINCSTSETIEGPPCKNITPLWWATVNGQTELVELLTNVTGVNVKCNKNGHTALHIASETGRVELVKLLLDHNADVNASHTDGATPPYVAAENGHTEVVKLLVDHNADVNASHTSGATPLYVACLLYTSDAADE